MCIGLIQIVSGLLLEALAVGRHCSFGPEHMIFKLRIACVAVPHNINGSLYCPMVAWRLHCVELQFFFFFTVHGKFYSLNPNDFVRAKTSSLPSILSQIYQVRTVLC